MRLTYHRFLLAQLLLAAVATTSNAFVVVTTRNSCNAGQQHSNRPSVSAPSSSFITLSASAAAAQSNSNIDLMDQLSDVTFTVSVKKPMGVIFGENPQPMLGLVVDDVSPGLNGGAAGLRDGDQLVAVNGQIVVGRDFDAVMSLLQKEDSSPLKLTMFRGSAIDLYTIVASLVGAGGYAGGAEEEEDVVVIDENYEAPRVVFEDVQEKPLTVGSVLNIFKKIGSNVADDMRDAATAGSKNQEEEEGSSKKKKGLFGGMFGGESIQLDGNDASTVK